MDKATRERGYSYRATKAQHEGIQKRIEELFKTKPRIDWMDLEEIAKEFAVSYGVVKKIIRGTGCKEYNCCGETAEEEMARVAETKG